MVNFINKNKLLATTAICAISVCANTVKAEEISILDILNNSQTVSPNIFWEEADTYDENTIQIGDVYYKYLWSNNDTTRDKYTTPQYNTLSGDVKADFIGISSDTDSVYNTGTIGNMTVNFIGNAAGGNGYVVLQNTGSISSITGNFIGNVSQLMRNSGTIGEIAANFIGNRNYDSFWGVLNNSSSIGKISGNFIDNDFGAIYNRGTIGQIDADFTNNINMAELYAHGGAISNDSDGTIISINGEFDGNAVNSWDVFGGAIDNEGHIVSITGNFTNNYANGLGGYGGAISNEGGTIDSIIADFTNNYASGLEGDGGAIHNTGTIGILSGDFIGNYVSGFASEGGAIYNEGSITLVADGSTDAENIFEQDMLFQDNYRGVNNYQAIYNSGTINFESRNSGSFTFYDSIGNSGTINLVSDNSVIDNNVAKFNMYNDITGAGTINVKNPYTFDMVNNDANTVSADSLNIEAETDLDIDVMLLTGVSDSFNVNTLTGSDNLTLNKINLVNDMDGIEYEKVIYSNQKLTGNEFTREQSTSKGRYSIVNDGQNLIITKVGESLGFAAFLTDVNDRYPDETYSFTEDEYMKRVLIGGRDATGDVVLGKGDITVFGNDYTLSYLAGESSKAMNLQEGQIAEINDLTIKGFETGLINNGTMTLNNVTLENNNVGIDNKTTGVLTLNNVNLKNNKTAINSSDILLQGENTISGGDYAMYLAGVATSLSPAYKYPLTGAIADFQLMEDAAEDGLTYSEYLANISAEASASLGYTVNITNGAEYIEVIVPILKQQEPSLCPSDIECAKLLGNIDITQDQYDELMEVVKTYGQENAGAGYVAIMLTSQHPEIPLSDMMAALYSQDATEQESLIDKIISDAITSGDITEAEKEAKTQELTAFITEGQQSLPQADAIYKENGIPSSYEYVTATVEKTPTATEYPLTGAFIDIMLAQEAADANMTYEQYMAEMAKSMGVEATNGAEFIEAMKELGEEVPESDREFFNETLGTNLTDAQYNEIIDVVKEYGEDHPEAGFMALMLVMEVPEAPLKDMMAILYAEDTTTQEALIDGLISKMVASGEIAEDEKDSAKQELTAFITEGQQGKAEYEAMYAQLGIPSPYGYVYVESSGAEGLGTTLNFAEGAILNLNSKVSGEDAYGLTLAGSDDAIINLNSEIEKADLVLDGPTLKLSDESTNLASVNSFEVKNGTLDMQNEVVRTLVAPNFKISGALKLFVDADLANKQMDTLGEVEVTDEGSISVDGIKIISDSAETETSVEFAEESYKDKVSTTVDNVLSTDYEYAVEYDKTTGEFKFVRGNKIASEEVAPNQAISVVNTTTVAAVETVVAQIFDRDVTISTDINYGADTTDYIETSDGVNIHNDKSLWVKTFGSDDDVEIENFNGKIDAESYGVVGGVDSKVFTYDNGVKAAYGIYGAYVGGKQKYDDNKVEQKSGYLGVSASFRKNNLFSNFTLNGGYITSKANTAWGKDEFDTKVVSVANKTGVDIKAGNNWTVTPAMYVAYTGMDTEDYTNKAGVKMENEFANVVTLAPELKARKGFNNGVGAYAKVSYKHYIYDSEVKADDIVLEEMSAKPYVEYGFGVEKNWADKSGYAELTRRDGGREGWNVNLGLKLDF